MNNKKYYDLVDRISIADSVDWCNKSDNKYDLFYNKTVDEAVELWKKQAIKTDKMENILKVYEDSNLLASDEDINIIHILLNHPEKDRLRLINDGSHYNNRIWFHVNNKGKITITPDIRWNNNELQIMSKKLNKKSPKEKIDFLFDNFEVVYIQSPVVNNKKHIMNMIELDKLIHEYDSDYLLYCD